MEPLGKAFVPQPSDSSDRVEDDDAVVSGTKHWTSEESLCLASSVLRNGDKDWVSISRSLKPFRDPKKPAEWYSPKECGRQYSELCKTVENKSERETPDELLVKNLTNSRLQELQYAIEESRDIARELETLIKLTEGGELDSNLDALLIELEKEESNFEEQYSGWVSPRELSPVKRHPKPATSPSPNKNKSPGKGKGKVPKVKEFPGRTSLHLEAREHDTINDLTGQEDGKEVGKMTSKISPRPLSSPQPFFNPSSVLAGTRQLSPVSPSSIRHGSLLNRRSELHDANASLPNTASHQTVSSVTLSAPTLSKLLEMPPSVPGKLPPLPTAFYSSDPVSTTISGQRAVDVSGSKELFKSGLYAYAIKDGGAESLEQKQTVKMSSKDQDEKERSPFKFQAVPDKIRSPNQRSPSIEKQHFSGIGLSSDRNVSYASESASGSKSYTFSAEDTSSEGNIMAKNSSMNMQPSDRLSTPTKTPFDKNQKKRRFFTSRDSVNSDESTKVVDPQRRPSEDALRSMFEQDAQNTKDASYDSSRRLSFNAENICQSPNEAIDFLKQLDNMEGKDSVHSSGTLKGSAATMATNFTPDSFLTSNSETKPLAHHHETQIYNVTVPASSEPRVSNFDLLKSPEKHSEELLSSNKLGNLLPQSGAFGSNMLTAPKKAAFVDNSMRLGGQEGQKERRSSIENSIILSKSSSVSQKSGFNSAQKSFPSTPSKLEAVIPFDSKITKSLLEGFAVDEDGTGFSKGTKNLELEGSSNNQIVGFGERTAVDFSDNITLLRSTEASGILEENTSSTETSLVGKPSLRKQTRKNTRKTKKNRSTTKKFPEAVPPSDESSSITDIVEGSSIELFIPGSEPIEMEEVTVEPSDGEKKEEPKFDDFAASAEISGKDDFYNINVKNVKELDNEVGENVLSDNSSMQVDTNECGSPSPASISITTEEIFAKCKEASKETFSGKQWSPQSSSKASQSMVTPTNSDISDETENTGDSEETDQTANSSETASSKKSKMKRKDRDSQHEYKAWKKSISIVWREAANHKYANVFAQKVTDDVAPGYQSIVKRPMDLSLIKKNIDNGTIRTTAEFQRDMMLMFQNAIMYNSSDHDVYEMAVEMQRDVNKQIQDYLGTQLIIDDKARDTSLAKSLRTVRRMKVQPKPQRVLKLEK